MSAFSKTSSGHSEGFGIMVSEKTESGSHFASKSMETVVSKASGEGGPVSVDVARTSSDTENPSLKLTAAKSLKRRAEVDKLDNSSDEEDSHEDFRSTAGKVINGQREVREEENAMDRMKLFKCQQEYYKEFFKILKQFLKSAFTIIVKNRKLCPSDGFQTVRVLGTKVPRFLHPSSLEYVEEVAKKIILFLNRNVNEGCAMHIMIEKNKTLHVVQRFVFKFHGSLDYQHDHDDEVTNMFDLEEVKNQCKISLVEILNCSSIKPMVAPQFSRWSLSIGIKQQFVELDEEAFNQLWSYDPSAGYFPWKKRPKSLAGTVSRRVSCKLDFSDIAAKSNSHGQPASVLRCDKGTDEKCMAQIAKPEKAVGSQFCEPSLNVQPVSQGSVITDSSSELCKTSQSTFTFSSGDTRGSCKISSGKVPICTEDIDGIFCFPVSSFQVMPGLTLTIYGLEYPAPREKVNVDVPSPGLRHARSPSIVNRLAHLKNRIFRQT